MISAKRGEIKSKIPSLKEQPKNETKMDEAKRKIDKKLYKEYKEAEVKVEPYVKMEIKI